MLSKRQETILKVIVSEYIKTAQPVGSKTIQELLDINVSSATIRNECSFLEEQDFLEKQHTSSGRIPSTKAYRYYVDKLMENDNIDVFKERLSDIFKQRSLSIDEVLNESSNIISEITKSVSFVITGVKNDLITLKKIELIPISESSAIVIFVLSNGKIKSQQFDLRSILINDLKIATDFFNENLVNVKLNDITTHIENLKNKLSDLIHKSDVILKSFLSIIIDPDMKRSQLKANGIKYLLTNPEFNDSNVIKNVLILLDNLSPFMWFKQQQERLKYEQKRNLLIGSETGMGIDSISIINKNIDFANGQTAAIAIVGPKRMEYNKITKLLDWFANKVIEEFKSKE